MGIYNRIFTGTTAGELKLPALRQDETARTAAALRALRAHVMIADTNNVIVAMNTSVERMLRAAEPVRRMDLDDFKRAVRAHLDARR